MIEQYLNVWIFLGYFGCKLAVYALCNKKWVPWSPLDSFSCLPFLPWGILCPPPPRKFIRLWNIPNSEQHFQLLCGASMMISAAFQYKGWSNVTMVWRLWQTKTYVDRMHALSPLYILIIGKNLTDNSPGYWLCWCKIRIIPCQFSVAWSWKISILLSKSRNRGRSKLWRFT